jgi:6-phosphofructokinase 1
MLEEDRTMPHRDDLHVKRLGERTFPSPLGLSTVPDDGIADYVPDETRVALVIEGRPEQLREPTLLEKAGPRALNYFEPKRTRAAIVTCGGLCPGINNVIRALVLELHHKYGAREVLGIRYGFEGLTPQGTPPIVLGPDAVRSIHAQGGSVLGLSRGMQDVPTMVDTLVSRGIDILFAVGGDGTLRGAHAIHREITRRSLPIAVVGVPKTIDNDIAFVDKTFGFETAVEVARLAIDAAHTEASSARNGIAIVKLMGRDAGFIAATASLASAEVNYCLVPEAPCDLEGPSGLFAALRARLEARGHAVIVVAEGCGAALADERGLAERDASGNVRYASGALDAGTHLRDAITTHFKKEHFDVTVKYIDPSYMLRGVPANATDAVFCDSLARNAAHAGMAGKTDIVIGRLHRVFVHVPIAVAVAQRKRIDPDGALWLAVTEATGQPRLRSTPSMTLPVANGPTVRR